MFNASRRPEAPVCKDYYEELVHLAWGEEPKTLERGLLIRGHAKTCDKCRLVVVEEWIDAFKSGHADITRPPNDILNEGLITISQKQEASAP